MIVHATLDMLGRKRDHLAPSHADFHPMNIFISGNERVSAIDIDKFCQDAPEADVGWFLMQTAAFDFFESGSFERSAGARSAFLEKYRSDAAQRIDPKRVGAYMARAFLKNLHFETVLLETGSDRLVKPWLAGARTAIFDGNLCLCA